MHEIATVIETDDEWATFRVQRSLACLGCDACGYSYANHMMVGRARNVAGAAVGDCVRIDVPTRHVLAVGSMVYLLPLALMVGGYAAVSLLTQRSALAAFGGVVGFVSGMLAVKALGGRLSRSEEFKPVVRAIIRQNPDREVT